MTLQEVPALDIARQKLKDAYLPKWTWDRLIDEMSDAKVMDFYFRFRAEGKLS